MTKKRLLALVLALVLIVGLVPTVWADEPTEPETEPAATEATEEGTEVSLNAENEAVVLAADATITSPVYYLSGTDWNMGVTSKTLTKSQDTTAMGTYVTNATAITAADLKALADDNSGESPDVDLVIYAHSGMAIGFASGTTWPDGTWVLNDSNSGKYKHGNWEWVWDGSVNYAVLADVTSSTEVQFIVVVDDTSTSSVKESCLVKIVIVPNTKPTLLRDALNGNSRYSVVATTATLYNYDGKLFNEYYNKNNGNHLAFASKSLGVDPRANLTNTLAWNTNSTGANGGGGYALMGIMKEALVYGLPEVSQGQTVDFFSTTGFSGKTVYPNVKFEFVYDNETGYYTYNSELNHAQYNESTNTIELYTESLSPVDSSVTTGQNSKAGFYPFADINEAFPHSSAPNLTVAEKMELLTNGVDSDSEGRLFADFAKDLVTSTSDGSTVDMHYGVHINERFYLPTGKQLNGKDMIYEFTGDDDLWVYIDGQLVLDIGGGHTPISGSFNLTTGEVWVEKYTQLSAANGGYYSTQVEKREDLKYTSDFLKGLAEDQMHTIQVFYLERHSGESNCRMHFNLPLVPENAVFVSKNLVNEDGEEAFAATPDTAYTFQIFTAEDDDDNIDAENFVPLANKEFTLLGGGTGKTDDDGMFTLTDGQTASFEHIERFTEVYVVEVKPDDGHTYSGISVNGGEKQEFNDDFQADTQIVQNSEPMYFTFTNYMQTYDLTVTKVVDGDTFDKAANDEFEFAVKIGGKAYTGLAGELDFNDETGTVKIKAGQSFTITGIPSGMTYEVTETAPAARSEYVYDGPKYVNATGAMDSDKTVTVTNTLRLLYGSLKIKKSGIADIDHNEDDEKQSTIYIIEGISGTNTAGIKLEVVVVGNGSVTVNHLPVGQYTVREKVEWSWRYIISGDNERTVSVAGNTTTDTAFVNSRSFSKWLSGDNFFKNLFDGSDNVNTVPTDPTE